MIKLSNTLSMLFGFFTNKPVTEKEVIKGSGSSKITVVLSDGTRIEGPEHEIKITPAGEVYFKVHNRWTLDPTVKVVTLVAH